MAYQKLTLASVPAVQHHACPSPNEPTLASNDG